MSRISVALLVALAAGFGLHAFAQGPAPATAPAPASIATAAPTPAPASTPASASAPAPVATSRLAILSLIGDRVTVVVRSETTGTALDLNRRTALPLPDRALDRLVLATAEDAVHAATPAVPTVLLQASGDSLYALQDEVLGAGAPEQVARLREALRSVLAGSGADRLLLVLKVRGPADWTQASGRVEGLGFFVVPPYQRDQRGGRERPGIVAPYAALRLLLLDAKTLDVLKDDFAIAHLLRRAPRDAGTRDEWERLTVAEKDELIRRLLVREIRRMVPRVIG